MPKGWILSELLLHRVTVFSQSWRGEISRLPGVLESHLVSYMKKSIKKKTPNLKGAGSGISRYKGLSNDNIDTDNDEFWKNGTSFLSKYGDIWGDSMLNFMGGMWLCGFPHLNSQWFRMAK